MLLREVVWFLGQPQVKFLGNIVRLQVRLGPWATSLRLLVCVRAGWSRRALVWGEWEPGASQTSEVGGRGRAEEGVLTVQTLETRVGLDLEGLGLRSLGDLRLPLDC